MGITERYYQVAGEWCVTHLPIKPNGFGVLLLGDSNNYVESKTSFWLEHIGRRSILEDLREDGYTIFSSNLFGRHWGNKYAYELALQQYTYVMRSEILNKQIHIVAEGMGALVAFEILNRYPEVVRSIVFISPCLHLSEYIHHERKNKFFYKRLMSELRVAYEVAGEQVLNITKTKSFTQDKTNIPVKIYVETNGYERELCDLYKMEKMKNDGEMELSYFVKERKYKIGTSITPFFNRYELNL